MENFKPSFEGPGRNPFETHEQPKYQVFHFDVAYGTAQGKMHDATVVVNPQGVIEKVLGKQDEADAVRDVRDRTKGDFAEHRHEVALPALTDAHNHPIFFGSALEMSPAFIFGISTPEDLDRAIKGQLKNKPGTQLALGWDTSTMGGLNREMLDQIREEPTFAVDMSYHGAVANTAAMRQLEEYLAKTGDLDKLKGHMDKDGHLYEEFVIACFELMEQGMDLDGLTKAAEDYTAKMRKNGTLYVHDMVIATPAQLEVFTALSEEARRSIRLAHINPRMLRYATSRGIDVSYFGLKLLADGANCSRTALYYEPYAGTELHGLKYHSEDDALEAMQLAADHGIFRVATHAIGDQGIDTALAFSDLWAQICQEKGIDGMARIEHMSMPTDEAIRRAAKMGLTVCPQPNFIPDVIPFNDRFDETRLQGMVPLRRMLDSGMRVMLGTDGMPNSMLLALHCATEAPFESQKIKLEEAIHASTATAGEYERANRGKIAVGMPADFLLTDQSMIDTLTSDQGLYRSSKENLSGEMDRLAVDLERRVLDVRAAGESIKQTTPPTSS
ncbi:MAG: amidohydrolase family protein [Patescibacteria group bacterium]|jgi:hypothetical protein